MGNNMFNDCECDFGKPKKKHGCGEYILGILIVALAVVLGLIIGAAVAETILAAISSLIILAIMLAILILIRFVSLICKNI